MVSLDITFEERVEGFTERRGPNVCWHWIGPMERGRPYIRGKSVLLYIYQREFGTIPPGFRVVRNDHVPGCPKDCVHSRCVNPAHLTIAPKGGPRATQKELCDRGHDLTIPENVYEASGRRWCRKCRNENSSDWERRNPNRQKNRRRDRSKGARTTDQEVMAE